MVQLKVFKSSSTNKFCHFKRHRRPETLKLAGVTLCSEQEQRWGNSWDKKLSILFVLDEIFY